MSIPRTVVLGFLLALCVPFGDARSEGRERVSEGSGRTTARALRAAARPRGRAAFIANRGQADARVRFYAAGRKASLYVTDSGISIGLGTGRRRWGLRQAYVGSRAGAAPVGEDPVETTYSWFRGTPDRWVIGVPAFRRVRFRELWRGIDATYTAEGDAVKATFVVAPGADPGLLRYSLEGQETVRVSAEGGLLLATPLGTLEDAPPTAFQVVGSGKVSIPIEFEVGGGSASAPVCGFRLGRYDPSLPLVIDPAIAVSSGFLGGAGEDEARAVAADTLGNAYVAGTTTSTEASFPVGIGPFDAAGGGKDAFVAKVSADGGTLAYCGFIGGAADDSGNGIAVDGYGNAYVVGTTDSDSGSFPVVVGPDLTYNGGTDAFVAKVNAAGTALTYCGYVGGNSYDGGAGIAVDLIGSAYITGTTYSTSATFPEKVGPALSNHVGFADAFVAKVASGGGSLVYCGYMGGDAPDDGSGIAVDALGSAYVVGTTYSDAFSFPALVGPYQIYAGAGDAFVAQLTVDGSGYVYRGYIGGAGIERGNAIAVNANGVAVITGYTTSTTFLGPAGPLESYQGAGDAFVAAVPPGGLGVYYIGYLGGNAYDEGFGVAVTPLGEAVVVGRTDSTQATFPAVLGPDLTVNGGGDAFVAKVPWNGEGLFCSGFLGGADPDVALGVALGPSGEALVVGMTTSTEATFPATGGPGAANAGGTDAYFARTETPGDLVPAVSRGRLIDSDREERDAFSASGAVGFDTLAYWAELDPGADGIDLEFGAPSAPYTLHLEPDLPGWKVSTRHLYAKYAWKSPPGVLPRVRLTLVQPPSPYGPPPYPGAGKFTLSVRGFDLPAGTGEEVLLRVRTGLHRGQVVESWEPAPRHAGVLRRR